LLEQNADPDVLSAEVAAAPSLEISNGLARLHKHYVGRGPTNARTTIDGDLVVCLLEGGYTRAEQTLEQNDNSDVVAAGRLGLQDAMRDAMIEVVQRTLGRQVHSFMSANDLHRNLQVEVFVLADIMDAVLEPESEGSEGSPKARWEASGRDAGADRRT
jgi:uncharacterized protein YbcI